MAYVRDPFKDDSKQSSGVVGGESVIGTDGQQITGDQSAKPVSNWTNLNAYIEGNQGSGANIADKMLEQGNADVAAADSSSNSFVEKAGKQVGDNTKVDTNDTWKNFFTTGDLSKATPDQTAAYKAWKEKPDYGGPADAASADGYNDAFSSVGKAKDSAARSYTQDSQYGLAKDSLGKGNQNYTGGMSMLDTVLARQAGGGQKLDDFNSKNSAENIQGKLTGAVGTVNGKIGEAKTAGAKAQTDVTSAINTKLGKTVGFISDREKDNQGSGDNAYATDHSLADYSSDAELAALNNLINGFGADTSGYNVGDLLNKSGADNTTVGQANINNQYGGIEDDGSSGGSLGYVWDPITQKQKVIGSAITKKREVK